MASHATPSAVGAVHDNWTTHSAVDGRFHAATRYSSSLLERQRALREAVPRQALRRMVWVWRVALPRNAGS